MASPYDRLDAKAAAIVRELTDELVADGAMAVVLTGSHARGSAQPESDIDFVALYRTKRGERWRRKWGISSRDGVMISSIGAAYTTAAAVRGAFREPRLIPTVIPGWRKALILHDAEGEAAQLRQEAMAFSWEAVSAECDAWVAEQVTGWAEEAHKLASALRLGRGFQAAANRSLLALHLAIVMAVRRRILVDTENELWDAVARELGEPWAATQRAALSLNRESLEESGEAALRLYLMAADEAMPLLSPQQRAVVERAHDLARGTIRALR